MISAPQGRSIVCGFPELPSFTTCDPHLTVTVSGVCPTTLSSKKMRRFGAAPSVLMTVMSAAMAPEGGETDAAAVADAVADGSAVADAVADADADATGSADADAIAETAGSALAAGTDDALVIGSALALAVTDGAAEGTLVDAVLCFER